MNHALSAGGVVRERGFRCRARASANGGPVVEREVGEAQDTLDPWPGTGRGRALSRLCKTMLCNVYCNVHCNALHCIL